MKLTWKTAKTTGMRALCSILCSVLSISTLCSYQTQAMEIEKEVQRQALQEAQNLAQANSISNSIPDSSDQFQKPIQKNLDDIDEALEEQQENADVQAGETPAEESDNQTVFLENSETEVQTEASTELNTADFDSSQEVEAETDVFYNARNTDSAANSNEKGPADVYEDGKIKIWNEEQLKLIGTNQGVTDLDYDKDQISRGNTLFDISGEQIIYKYDADYLLMEDIELSKEDFWIQPEEFDGTMTSGLDPPEAETEEGIITETFSEDKGLYDDQNDTIYIYTPWQLRLLLSEDREKQPVMTGDNAAETFGMGQLIYPDSLAGDYLTYSAEHNYKLISTYNPENKIPTIYTLDENTENTETNEIQNSESENQEAPSISESGELFDEDPQNGQDIENPENGQQPEIDLNPDSETESSEDSQSSESSVSEKDTEEVYLDNTEDSLKGNLEDPESQNEEQNNPATSINSKQPGLEDEFNGSGISQVPEDVVEDNPTKENTEEEFPEEVTFEDGSGVDKKNINSNLESSEQVTDSSDEDSESISDKEIQDSTEIKKDSDEAKNSESDNTEAEQKDSESVSNKSIGELVKFQLNKALNSVFNAEMPDPSEPINPEGREYAGQTEINIDGTNYVLIGDWQQLEAIDQTSKNNTVVDQSVLGIPVQEKNIDRTGPIWELKYACEYKSLGNDNMRLVSAKLVYPGDADLVSNVDDSGKTNYIQKEIIYYDIERSDVDLPGGTGDTNHDKRITNIIKKEEPEIRYSDQQIDFSKYELYSSLGYIQGIEKLCPNTSGTKKWTHALPPKNYLVNPKLGNDYLVEYHENGLAYAQVGVKYVGGTLDEPDPDTTKYKGNYSRENNYIVFRNIDMGLALDNVESGRYQWTPYTFRGEQFLGVNGKAASVIGKKLPEAVRENLDYPVTIRNLSIKADSKNIVDDSMRSGQGFSDTSSHLGIGFFGTLSTQGTTLKNASDGQIYVKNVSLENVDVFNDAKYFSFASGLIDSLLLLLEAIPGLGDLLKLLLNPSHADPSYFATGAFAGKLYGEVIIHNCSVKNLDSIKNVSSMTGGFIGSAEGITEYDIASKALEGLLTLLEKILSLIPILDLGTLIRALLMNGGLIDLDQLIVTGYNSSKITNCSVSYADNVTVGNSSTEYNGGFIGRQIGTYIEGASVRCDGKLNIQAKNMAGGFSGLTTAAELEGVFQSLGIELFNAVRLNSFVLDSQVGVNNLSISSIPDSSIIKNPGGEYAGGFSGALCNSFLIDSTLTSDSLVVNARNYAGGATGRSTVAMSLSLGEAFYDGKQGLISEIVKLLAKLLKGGDSNATLLALTGVSSSVLAGVQIDGNSKISTSENYAGGMVGLGEGLTIFESDPVALSEKSFAWRQYKKHDGDSWYNGKSQVNFVSVSFVSAENFAGGAVGQAKTASVAGLIDGLITAGDYLPLTCRNLTIEGGMASQNNEKKYSVHASENYAGGVFGQVIGGNVGSVQVIDSDSTEVQDTADRKFMDTPHPVRAANLESVSAKNYAGGFSGSMGTGKVADAGGLNILGLVKIGSLLSVGDTIKCLLKDCSVTGISSGYSVTATGYREDADRSNYLAGGFIGESGSAVMHDCHAYNAKNIEASIQNQQLITGGVAGGFVAESKTGGLVDLVEKSGSVTSLLEISNLLSVGTYYVPEYINCTVNYIDSDTVTNVQGDIAGGFAGYFESGTLDNSEFKLNGKDSPYAVYNINKVKGRSYAGGMGGNIYSGSLASSDGLSVSIAGIKLLEVDINNFLGLINVYRPIIQSAGVSSGVLDAWKELTGGFTVEASLEEESMAGGYVGFASGAEITDCNVEYLREVSELNEILQLNQTLYSVSGNTYVGGFAGLLGTGSLVSSDGLNLLGLVKAKSLLSVGDSVQCKIKNCLVNSGVKTGYTVQAAGRRDTSDFSDNSVYAAGGFVGEAGSASFTDCHVINLTHVQASIVNKQLIDGGMAGGFVGQSKTGGLAEVGNVEADITDFVFSLLSFFLPVLSAGADSGILD